MKNLQLLLILLFFSSANLKSFAQSITQKQLDILCERALQTFNVPGLAVVIVKDGEVVVSSGYGLRSIKDTAAVDRNTLFGIASNSKAFTAAAIGILIDEGKLKLDDKLTDYLPEFKMYDDCVTKEFTIRDMLTHRSGLGLGAGDLMHNPDSSNFTIKDIIAGLHYLKPASSFRSGYAYDNILYLVAGELIHRVSGLSWDEFIEQRIFFPLKMNSSRASYYRAKTNPDIIDAHRMVNGKLQTFSRSDVEVDAGAGGIYSSANDMGKWMLIQLANGKYSGGRLFSEVIHQEMWTPQVIIPVYKTGTYQTHFGAYGLGWFLTDAKGYLEVSHTGQDDGMVSEVELIPELQLGVTVLSNQEGGGAVRAVTDQVIDTYLGIKGIDRVKYWAAKVNAQNETGDQIADSIWTVVKKNSNSGDLNSAKPYVGLYRDNWFGNAEVAIRNGHLWFRSIRSPQLRGRMFQYQQNVFAVRWENPQIQADALLTFIKGKNGKADHFTIKRLSPKTSSAFDFQDLYFRLMK